MTSKKKLQANQTGNPEPVHKEIPGLLFLLLSIIFGVSLVTYHPSDPLFLIRTGYTGNAANLFGTIGAHISGITFFLIGFSSFWIIGVFLLMSIYSFMGKHLSQPIKSFLSGIFLILSSSGIISLQWSEGIMFRGSRVVSGGLLGDFLSGNMVKIFNFFGTYVLLAAVFIISLMICTRFSFGSVFSVIYRWIIMLFRKLNEYLLKKKEQRRKKVVREQHVKKVATKPKRKVTIIEPLKEPKKKPEQEAFPFMQVPGKYKLPGLDLLEDPPETPDREIQRESLEMNARRLEKKLADFGVVGEVVEILPGPVITMYELKPAPGVKISKVAGLSDDLALALRASSVRIVAPIPGKAAIGIEIANNQRDTVHLKDVLSSAEYRDSRHRLTIALGKDITGAPVVADLAKMPHLLVAGATGTGKSVSLNAMINSLLFKVTPDMARFLMVDPKRIELSTYKDIPHLLHPVVTEPKDATKALRWAVGEMERRYMLLSDRGVRNIEAYNRKILKESKSKSDEQKEGQNKPLPYIIIIIDELADLMMVSTKDVEEAITRLAQMARAAGLHLIIATQRPSVDVLTGIIKANFPTRMSFQVSSRVDSRTILDSIGAENLLGDGDMLFMPPGVGRLNRIHGAYISEEDVGSVTNFVRSQMTPEYDETIVTEVSKDEETVQEEMEMDEKYDLAVEIVCQSGQASISMVQRKLRVGYNRAARMIEAMEKEGIVGPSDGVKHREVYGRRME